MAARQQYRKTERQRDKETERQKGSKTERQRDRETKRQRDKEKGVRFEKFGHKNERLPSFFSGNPKYPLVFFVLFEIKLMYVCTSQFIKFHILILLMVENDSKFRLQNLWTNPFEAKRTE